MDKQNLFPACPVETTLKLIGDKWNVLILRDLFLGTKRFSELKRSLAGVSQKVLTSQLRGMEEAGLVSRAVYPEVPPRGTGAAPSKRIWGWTSRRSPSVCPFPPSRGNNKEEDRCRRGSFWPEAVFGASRPT